MQDDLQEIRDRLKWASSEIETLSRDVKKFNETAYAFSEAPHILAGMKFLMVEQVRETPVSIRARAGTIINEIRSCLDALACALAARNSRTPNQVYFPIVETEGEFLDPKKGQDKIRKLSAADRQLIAGLKPYLRDSKDQPGNIMLWGLHKADLKRKHQRLAAYSTKSSLVFGDGLLNRVDVFANKLVGKTAIAAVARSNTLSYQFLGILSFDEPDVLSGREVVTTLYEFVTLAGSIVQIFS